MAKLKIVEEVEEEEEIEDVEEVKEPAPFIETKMTQSEFLKSIGQADRPGSHMAITAWAEYQAS